MKTRNKKIIAIIRSIDKNTIDKLRRISVSFVNLKASVNNPNANNNTPIPPKVTAMKIKIILFTTNYIEMQVL